MVSLGLLLFAYSSPPAYIGIEQAGGEERLVIISGKDSRILYRSGPASDPKPYDMRIRWFAPSPSGKFVALLRRNGQELIILDSKDGHVRAALERTSGSPYLTLPTWRSNDRLLFVQPRHALNGTSSYSVYAQQQPDWRSKLIARSDDRAMLAVRFLGWHWPSHLDEATASIVNGSLDIYLYPDAAPKVASHDLRTLYIVQDGKVLQYDRSGRLLKTLYRAPHKTICFLKWTADGRLSVTLRSGPPQQSAFGGDEQASGWFTDAYSPAAKPRQTFGTILIDPKTGKTTSIPKLIAAEPVP